MSKTETAIAWMEQTAKDNLHGYDQKYRWGEKGDYDCSSAVITAWETAGVPVKTKGATYTGNMYSVFKKCGFKDVTSGINLKTGSGLLRGDVLLHPKYHTAMYCGNGKIVNASINEKGKTTGGTPGDQTWKEFLIRTYYNYPWKYVLRYSESQTIEKATGKTVNIPDYKYYNNYTVVVKAGLNVRYAPTTNAKIKKAYKVGTVFTCLEKSTDSNGSVWIRTPSGWVCAFYAPTGSIYAK